MNIIKRVINSIRFRWYLFTTQKKSKAIVQKLIAEENEIKLEIGSGEKKGKNGWTTLDMNDISDLNWDLRLGIPFPDNTVSAIYSSHLFEHLTFSEIQGLLNECKRVLKPKGTFSICVPNARLYIDAYLNNNSKFLELKPSFLGTAYNNTTRIDLVNYIAYMNGFHKYMFDEENILCILKKAGFNNVKPRQYDPETDLQGRDYESLYAIAEK
jgi:predicted SAM-dependent methyltransferase